MGLARRIVEHPWLALQGVCSHLATGDAADHALTFAEEDQTRVNDPYVTEVDENGQIAGREVLRETIRAKGPTIHPDLGKQAGNA